jgi:hypothetical protein
MAPQLRNKKHEIRNTKQIPMTKKTNPKQWGSYFDFGISDFGIVWDFGFRISGLRWASKRMHHAAC